MNQTEKPFAWIVSTEMGYGHLRAAYSLKHIAISGEIIDVSNIKETRFAERIFWRFLLRGYVFLSRSSVNGPLRGVSKRLLNTMLYIPEEGKEKKITTVPAKILRGLISIGLCSGMIKRVSTHRAPVISSFYACSEAASMLTDNKVFCVICDADLNRIWVSANPDISRINYFVPTYQALNRLKEFGVGTDKIHLTGFPLPVELLGNRSLNILEENYIKRIRKLENYENQTINIAFAIGGAGAQSDYFLSITKSMKPLLRRGNVKLTVITGTHKRITEKIKMFISEEDFSSDEISILYSETIIEYFAKFNELMKSTDILWTKPSELSFFCALGIPIIIAPPIGPQEICNRKWLFETSSGTDQPEPEYSGEWLETKLREHKFIELASNGYRNAPKDGTFRIEDLIRRKISNYPFTKFVTNLLPDCYRIW